MRADERRLLIWYLLWSLSAFIRSYLRSSAFRFALLLGEDGGDLAVDLPRGFAGADLAGKRVRHLLGVDGVVDLHHLERLGERLEVLDAVSDGLAVGGRGRQLEVGLVQPLEDGGADLGLDEAALAFLAAEELEEGPGGVGQLGAGGEAVEEGAGEVGAAGLALREQDDVPGKGGATGSSGDAADALGDHAEAAGSERGA